jgi:hypothetical protein
MCQGNGYLTIASCALREHNHQIVMNLVRFRSEVISVINSHQLRRGYARGNPLALLLIRRPAKKFCRRQLLASIAAKNGITTRQDREWQP